MPSCDIHVRTIKETTCQHLSTSVLCSPLKSINSLSYSYMYNSYMYIYFWRINKIKNMPICRCLNSRRMIHNQVIQAFLKCDKLLCSIIWDLTRRHVVYRQRLRGAVTIKDMQPPPPQKWPSWHKRCTMS